MPAGFKWLYLYPFAYLHYIYVCDDNTIPVKGTEEKIQLVCYLWFQQNLIPITDKQTKPSIIQPNDNLIILTWVNSY